MTNPASGPDAIIDAGPALTFLARKDSTRILFTGLGASRLLAPDQVDVEVRSKSRADQFRFGAAQATWDKITSARRLTILPDDETPELAAAIQRFSYMPMSDRMRDQQDLGELLVVAHASVRAEAGEDIVVLIQERNGTLMAHNEARRISRLNSVGSLRVWDTTTILLRAAGTELLPDRATMKKVYKQMRELDLALPPIDETKLLDSRFWDA